MAKLKISNEWWTAPAEAENGQIIMVTGRRDMQAVKETVGKQSGLTPANQHHLFRRWRRFKLTTEDIWQLYLKQVQKPLRKPEFLYKLEEVSKDNFIVTETILYIHLLDQWLWQLISTEEVQFVGNKLLKDIAEVEVVEAVELRATTLEGFVEAWKQLLVGIMVNRCSK